MSAYTDKKSSKQRLSPALQQIEDDLNAGLARLFGHSAKPRGTALSNQQQRHRSPQIDAHPAAALFPMMTEERLTELVADIKHHGLLKPIEMYQEQIIDGRNRLEACKRAGINPDFKDVTGQLDGDPRGYVASVNLKRRDLTDSQRAAIIAELATLPVGANQHRKEGVSVDTASAPTLDKAAKMVGVGRATVARVKAVKKADPAIFEKVKAGKMSVNQAYKQSVQRTSEQKEDSALTPALISKPVDEHGQFIPLIPPMERKPTRYSVEAWLMLMNKADRIATFRRLMLACHIAPDDLTPHTNIAGGVPIAAPIAS